MNKNTVFAFLFFFLMISMMLFWFSCQKTTNPTGVRDEHTWVIDSLYTLPATFPFQGVGYVYAEVVDQETGEACNDASIYISFSSPSDSGLFGTPTSYLNSDGIAISRLSLAGRTDTSETLIVIDAMIEYPNVDYATYYLRVGDQAISKAADIELEAEPDSVYVGSGDTVFVTCAVIDSFGSTVANNRVYFESVSRNFTIPAGNHYTDLSGICTLPIPVPTASGEAILRAFVYDGDGEIVDDTVHFWFIPEAPVSNIQLSSDDLEITADGISTTTLTASVYIGYPGAPAPDGTPVRFESDNGNFRDYVFLNRKNHVNRSSAKHEAPNGSKETQSSWVAYTEGGVAKVILISSTVADSVEITAQADSVTATHTIYFVAGPPALIDVVANSTSLVADGSDTTSIFATVTDQYGNNVGIGTSVNFSPDLGTCTPTSASTNQYGQARVLLTSANSSGLATILASNGSIIGQVEVVYRSTTPVHLSMSVDPGELLANGRETATVTVQALDENYIAVTDGVPINFETTLGTYSPASLFLERPVDEYEELLTDGITNDDLRMAISEAMLEDDFVALTSEGFASVTLKSDTIAGTAILRCYHMTGSTMNSVDSARVPFDAGAPQRIEISFHRDTITANGADTTTVFATVYDEYSNPVGTGYTVTFNPIEGSVFPTSQATDVDGIARTKLTSSLNSGLYYVTASTGDATGNSSIFFEPSVPVSIDVRPAEYTMSADGSSTNTITAHILDAYDRPVSNGTRIEFYSSLGEFSMSLARPMDDDHTGGHVVGRGLHAFATMEAEDLQYAYTTDGIATANLISPTVAGTALIYASAKTDSIVDTDTLEIADTTYVDYISGDISRIELTATPDTILAGGVERSIICATLFDEFDNPMDEGIVVTFMTTLGEIVSPIPTDSTGTACTYLEGGSETGPAMVTASAAGTSAIVYIELEQVPVSNIMLSLIPSETTVDGSPISLSAYVTDSTGYPVSDSTPIHFESVIGEIIPLVDRTSMGVAEASLSPSGIVGYDTVIARFGTLVADTAIARIKPGAPASIVLEINPDTMYAGGLPAGQAQAYVTDVYGNPVAEGTVITFSIGSGSVIPEAPTDSLGYAYATITSPVEPGVSSVTASFGLVSTMAPVVFESSPASEIILTVSSNEITLDEVCSLTVVAIDTISGVISDGIRVTFGSTISDIIPPIAFVELGEANSFAFPTGLGSDTIIAYVGAISDTAIVRYKPGNVARIEVAPDIDWIYANGSATTKIRAVCYDSEDNPVGRGIRVEFNTSLGSLSPSSSFGITDTLGEATITLQSGVEPGTATIEASFEEVIAFTSVDFIRSNAARITLMPSARSFDIGESITLRTLVYDSLGASITDATPVVLESNLGIPVPPVPRTTDGEAISILTDRGTIGLDTIIATVDMISDTITVDIEPGLPARIILTVGDSVIYANGSQTTTIEATVYDLSDNLVGAGVTVNFNTSLGTLEPAIGVTEEDGTAMIQIRSGFTQGIAVIQAWIEGTEVVAITTIDFINSNVGNIQIIPSSPSIKLGEIDTLRVMVQDTASIPITDNTPVFFESSRGLVIPGVARTLDGETFSYLYTAGTPGVDTVRAWVDTLEAFVEINILPGEPASIALSASPEMIFANGIDKSDITATLLDAEGNPLGQGLSISFSTSLGSIVGTGITDINGTTTVELSAGHMPGTANITASYLDITQIINVEFDGSDAYWIELIPSSSEIQLGNICTLNVVAYDSFFEPISDESQVRYESEIGLVIPPATITLDGQTQSFLYTNEVTGQDSVIARMGSVFDYSIIRFIAGDPYRIEISATPETLYADGLETSDIQVMVYDADGYTVGAGISVEFDATAGSIFPETILTNEMGEASATFQAPASPTTAYITVRVGGIGGIEASEVIYVIPSDAHTITLIPSRTSISLEEACTLDVYVYDSHDSYISDGTRINFTSLKGLVTPPIVETMAGHAQTILHTQRVVGTDTIAAIVGSIADTVYINFTAGAPASIILSANPETMYANGFSRSRLEALVLDTDGNPVRPGIRINFSATLGGLESSIGVTDDSGIATVYLRSGTSEGTSVIQAWFEDVSGLTMITFDSAPVGEIQIIPSSSSIGLGEIDTIRIMVFDTSMVPITDNTRIDLTSEKGMLIPSVLWTLDGEATTYLYTDGNIGLDTISVSVGDSVEFEYIEIEAGIPATMELSASPEALPANGITRAEISALVLDDEGNHLGSGFIVNFITSLGTIADRGVTDINGIATTNLTASNTPGVALVGAALDDIEQYINVDMIYTNVAEIDMWIEPSSINLGDSAIISISCIDDSLEPVTDGTRIELRSSFGVIQPRVVRTTDGEAFAVFKTDSMIGTAEITAIATDSVQAHGFIEVNAGVPHHIEIVAAEDHLYANGIDTTSVMATVYDEDNNPVGQGYTVNWSTDLGTLLPAIGITDIGGQVTIRYQSDNDPGLALIRASIGGIEGFETITLEESNVAYIDIYPASDLIRLGETDTISVYVYDADSLFVSDGTRVRFSTDLGLILPPTVETVGGYAFSILNTRRETGIASVTATVDTVSVTDTVQIIAGEPDRIILSADTTELYANGLDYTEIQAVLVDEDGNPIGGGLVISFSTDMGTVTTAAMTDDDDTARVIFTASTEIGVASVRAEYGGVTSMIPITLIESIPTEVDLIPYKDEIGLDEICTLQVFVSDPDGSDISDGTRVTFHSELCRVEPRYAETFGGTAFAVLYPRDTIGTDMIIASCGDAADSAEIEILPGSPYDVLMTAEFDSIYANGISSTGITARVYDAFGNPIRSGKIVEFRTDLGSVVGVGITDSTGMAISRLTSESITGIAIVTAICDAASGAIPVKFFRSPILSLNLTADDRTLAYGDSTAIRATLIDVDSTYVSDGTLVFFSARGGEVRPVIQSTDDGEAIVKFMANDIIGDAWVIAQADTVVDSILITVDAGDPDRVTLEAEFDTIYANGISTDRMTATVYDEVGNHVGPGITVEFATTMGSITPVANTDTLGQAVAILLSNTETGWANITATAGGASANYPVLFDTSPAKIIEIVPEEFVIRLGESTNLRAIVIDSSDVEISDGTRVRFGSRLAEVNPVIDRTTGGQANSVLQTTTEVGIDSVYAYVDTVFDFVNITILPGDPSRITASTEFDTIYANGISSSKVYAHVVDRYGNAVEDGIPVTFSTTLGEITSIAYTDSIGLDLTGKPVADISLADTVVHGYAVSEIQSPTEIGIGHITARNGSVVGVTDIVFDQADAARIILSPSSYRISLDEVDTLTALVYDTGDIPIGDGTRVEFEAKNGLGLVLPPFQPTADGEATVIFDPLDTIGIECIVAIVDSVRDSIFVELTPGIPASIELSVVDSLDTIPANGYSTAPIHALVTDRYGNPVDAGAEIEFTTSRGTIEPVSQPTDDDGEADVTLTSSTTAGLAVVRGELAGGIADQVQVMFISSDVGEIILSIENNNVQIGDDTPNDLTALVLDTDGRRVTDGTEVEFISNHGTIIPPSDFTLNGVANTNYAPGIVDSTDTIIATAAGGAIADTITCLVRAGLCQDIAVSVSPDTIASEGRGRSVITATCRDFYGNLVGAGRDVTFSTSLGSIVGGSVTDASGQATTILTSGVEIGTALIQARCEEGVGIGEVEIIEPTIAFISLVADPLEIAADGVSTSSMTARIFDEDANPIPSGLIEFTSVDIDSTILPLGDIDSIAPISAGVATATLRSEPQLGTALVTAQRYGVSDDVEVDFIPGLPDRILMVAAPDTIPADGSSTSDITATVYDEYDNIVEVGTEVTFSTSYGAIDPTRGWTDDSGQVEIELTSADSIGRATITAESGSAVGFTRVVFSQINAFSIDIYSDSLSLEANGNSRTKVTATVLDSIGAAVPNGTPIRFYTSEGIMIPNATTTSEAIAESELRASINAGDTAYVYADAGGGVISDSLAIYLRPGPAGAITLAPVDSILPADGDTFTIVDAHVTDIYGNEVAPGTQITFSTSLGDIDTVTYTDASGNASVRFNVGTTPGIAQVIANSADAIGFTNVTLINTDVATIFISVDPARITVGATSTAEVSGQALNDLGAPVSDGSPISLSVTNDTLGSVFPTTATTDSGYYYATFRASRTSGQTYIRAEANGHVDSVEIELLPDLPYRINLTSDSVSIDADSISITTVSATVYDRFDNVVNPGTEVSFVATLGTIGTPAFTDVNGQVEVTLRSGRESGICRITATSGEARANHDVTFDPTDPYSVFVVPDDAELIANGFSSTFLRATVTDSSGSPVSDGTPVTFGLKADTLTGDTLGTILPTTATTAGGTAVVQLRAGTGAGTSNIFAYSGSDTGFTAVDFVPGDPNYLVISSDRDTLLANGIDNATITCIVYDRYGNTVDAGLTVSFSSTMGDANPRNISTDNSGEVRITFTASNVPGTARLYASCGAAYGSYDIEFDEVEASYLSIIADPIRIIADGASASGITARVLNELGQPVPDGTVVIFHSVNELDSTEFGTMDTLATTSGGEADVTLRSETVTGNAIVTARLSSNPALNDTTGVTFIPGPVASVEATVDDAELPADGRAPTTVKAVIKDENGNRVATGTIVTASTDNGTILPTTVYTDTSDTVEFEYTASTSLGRATVTISSGGISDVVFIDLIEPFVGTVYMTVDSSTITANGVNSSTVRATVLDSLGYPAGDGVPVYFDVDNGVIFPQIVNTIAGNANTVYTSGTDPSDSARITATAGDSSDVVYVDFTTGVPAIVELEIIGNLTADDTSTATIVATVKDAMGNEVEESENVSFTTTLGDIDEIGLTSTDPDPDSLGKAYVEMRSGPTPGTALIRAECEGAISFLRVDISPVGVAEITISADEYSLVADGIDLTRIYGSVWDSSGIPVPDGSPVQLRISPDSSLGDISPTRVFTAGGSFESELTSGTTTGECYVTAYVGIVADSTRIDLVPGAPAFLSIDSDDPGILADSSSSTRIYGTIFDRDSNAVAAGVSVTTTTTLGWIAPTTVETNAAGQFATYLYSGLEEGRAYVTSVSGDASDLDSVDFSQEDVATINLSANPRVLTANGFDESAISATVKDSLGHNITNGTTIIFETFCDITDTVSGDLIPDRDFTLNGQARSVLRAGENSGRLYLLARNIANTVADTIMLTLEPGDPSSIVLTAEKDTISANGRDNTNIYADVYDAFGNPVQAGVEVSFTSSMGTINPGRSNTDSDGNAFSNLTAGTESGISRILVSAGEVSNVIEVNIIQSGIGNIVFTVDQRELTADGSSFTNIVTEVFDNEGSPVTDGTRIDFSTNAAVAMSDTGTIVSPKLTLGGSSVTKYTAGTSVGSGRIWIIASVYDSIASATEIDSTWIKLVPGDVAHIDVYTNPDTSLTDTIAANGSSEIDVYAVLTDEFGNPLDAGNVVNFTTDLGTIVASAVTNGDGMAVVELTSGFEPGRANIEASSGGISGLTEVEFEQTPVDGIFLSAETINLTANGTDETILTAELFDATGVPVSNGTVVEFSLDPSAAASVLPSLARTDSGLVQVRVRANTAVFDSFVVMATDSAGADTTTLTMYLNPGPPERIEVHPNADDADTLFADGVSTIAVTCSLYDAYSNPVKPGEVVSFEATLGSLPLSAFTNVDGVSSANFQTGTETGVSLITVRSGAAVGFGQVVLDSLEADELTLTATPARIPADGTSSSAIQAIVQDASGFPVSDGTKVTFETDAAAGFIEGIIIPSVDFTEGGSVNATLTALGVKGQCRIIASVGATVVDSFIVNFEPGEPAFIEFVPDTTYPADGSQYPIKAFVLDENRNAVEAGTDVTFVTTLGDVATPSSVSDADSGTVESFVSSDTAGTAIVRATSGAARGVMRIDYTEVEAYYIDMAVIPGRLTADGSSTANIIANVSDSLFNPISDNQPITISTTAGVLSPSTAYTLDGRIEATLTAGITANDSVIIIANAGINVAGDTIYAVDTIVFEPGPIASITFDDTARTMYANGIDVDTLWITARDQYDNTVKAGTPISFASTMGDVAPTTLVTNVDGRAFTILTAGTSHGLATITASSGGITGYAIREFIRLEPATIDLFGSPITIRANSIDESNLTALVFDSTGSPVSDGNIVTFTTSHGVISPRSAETVDGQVTTTLTSGVTPEDSVIVVATSDVAVDTFVLEFTPGDPNYILLTASATSIVANSASSCSIYAAVYDEYGNHVSESTPIRFTSTLGLITPSDVTDSSGVATGVLNSESEPGWAIVTADWEGTAEAQILIQFARTDVGEVSVVVVPNRIPVGGASSATVSVSVLDTSGVPVSSGTPVRFSRPTLGVLDPIYVTTDASGGASATLTSLTDAGSENIIALSDTITDTTTVTYLPGDPDYVILTVGRDSLFADGGDTTIVTATIYDEYGNALGEGIAVDFTTVPDSAAGEIGATAVTNGSGQCSVVYTTGYMPGTISIIAELSTGGTGATQITLYSTEVDDIILNFAGPSTLPADGSSTTDINVTVLDDEGAPVTDGTRVNLFISQPDSTDAYLYPSWIVTSGGVGIATLTASTNVDTVAVYARYRLQTFPVTYVNDTIEAVFEPGEPSIIEYSYPGSKELVADGADSYTDTVTIMDAFRNAIPDQFIEYDLTVGNIDPINDVTNASGQAFFNITAPNSVGYGLLTTTAETAEGIKSIRYRSTGVSEIRLSVSPRGLPADGVSEATARAVVLDSTGSPASDGLLIRFESNVGIIAPVGYTNDGAATATLRAGDINGTDTIIAYYEVDDSVYAADTTICIYEAGPPAEIDMRITDNENIVGSDQRDTIRVTVRDGSGNPVVLGTPVEFTLNDPIYGSISSPVSTTDDTGFVEVIFTPGTQKGTAWIAAQAGDIRDSVYIILRADDPTTMEFEVSRASIYVRGAGEIDNTTIFTRIYDLYGNTVSDSIPVEFVIKSGPGMTSGVGTPPSLEPWGSFGRDTSATRYTTDGAANITLNAGDSSGTVIVEARVNPGTAVEISTEAPRITITSGLPATASVSVSDCNVHGWLTDGIENNVTVFVSDGMDNPVAPGTAVYFTCDEGVVTGSAVTDSIGRAYATWYSADPRDDGQVRISAEVEGASGVLVSDTTGFYNSGPPVNMVSLSASPSTIYADGESESEITARFTDINDNPVDGGVYEAVFRSSYGEILESPIEIGYVCGDAAAEAVAIFKSEVATEDQDTTGGIPGKVMDVNIIAWSASASDNVDVTMNHGRADAEKSGLTVPTEMPESTSVYILATVLDSWGNPIGGDDVTFTATQGSFSPASDVTSASGYASAVFTAPAIGGSDDISVVISASIASSGAVIQQSLTIIAGKGSAIPDFDPGYSEEDLMKYEELGLDPQPRSIIEIEHETGFPGMSVR